MQQQKQIGVLMPTKTALSNSSRKNKKTNGLLLVSRATSPSLTTWLEIVVKFSNRSSEIRNINSSVQMITDGPQIVGQVLR